VGNPFTPAGADYQIFARQGIDAAHPTGNTSFSPGPQVNTGAENLDALAFGVSYQPVANNSNLTDFGIGLYTDAGNAVHSTGLNIQYNQLVLASSVTVRLVDFDIDNKDSFFKPTKVEPSLLLFGPGGALYASATPTDIFNSMTFVSKDSDGTWDLNFGALLQTKNLPDGPISGFLLYADAANGEDTSSDPYFLQSIGNGVVVPEAGNFVAGLAAIAFGGLFHLQQVRRQRKAVTVSEVHRLG
jgi:hypothetical protein